ncbi:uncharacterized protein LOC133158022 isoform X2 [Syngnathus typhle]|uniref:uncharacterized protein LOC133158022 isoform X2 n=1 Tax=Syngnathus typhle TaxID=161592 RepID=UPI002A6AC6CB|nr:uncharacterized protein LOC133158022 isoform X2 [Syngnathus typhle]
MEPDVLTDQQPATRASLDDDIEEAGSDKEEFRGFSPGLVASAIPASQLKCNFLPPGGPLLPLTNGFCHGPEEEAGFADFAVFAEQTTHPWCCGFSGATTPSIGLREARDIIMDSKPASSHRRLHLRTQNVPQMPPTSDDQDSLLLEEPSEGTEPNVSSLTSYGDHTDDDDDDRMVEDMCAASQETCPTSKQSSQFLPDNSRGPPSLPPSESFADFCSAATQQDGGEKWADFKDQSNHTQQLLQVSFPETVGKEEEEEEEVPRLEALLHPQRHPVCEEDTFDRARTVLWLPHQDVHCAAGLKFRWGGSHANRTLLRCLGVVSGNMESRKDCYLGHTVTTYKTQTLNQLNAAKEKPRP